jgi:U3 small nucleolar RNA-associated protein 7
VYDLELEFGQYFIDFTRNGQSLALAGSKGHVALMEWKTKKLVSEFQVKEKVKDVKWLHSEQMVAVAQKQFVHIYDHQGLEVHRLRNMPEPIHLEYLPFHYLLTSISAFGLLSYQDISTGQIVVEHKTKVRDVSGQSNGCRPPSCARTRTTA